MDLFKTTFLGIYQIISELFVLQCLPVSTQLPTKIFTNILAFLVFRYLHNNETENPLAKVTVAANHFF